MTFATQMKGFPFWQMFIMGIMRFAEPLAFTSLFPYIYFMIRDFGVAPDPESIPKYAGYMASVFSLTQFLFGMQWGSLSDKIGRKPVILIGISGTGVCMLIFGFAPNFYVALAARAIMGAVNGNVAVMRTSIGERIHDKSQQVIAFLMIPFLFNVGMMIGPLIGSLANMTSENEGFDRFLQKFPYGLPNIIVSSYLFFAAIMAVLFLEETNPRAHYKDYGLEVGDMILRGLGFKVPNRGGSTELDETSRLLDEAIESEGEDGSDDDPLEENIGGISPEVATTIRRLSMPSHDNQYKAALTKPVIQVLIANATLFFQTTIQYEFMPVLLSADPTPERLSFPWKMSGGFGFPSSMVANIMVVTGIAGLIVMILFPYIERKLKGNVLFRVSLFPYIFTFAAQPLIIYTTPEYDPKFPRSLSVGLIYAVNIVYEMFVCMSIPEIALLTHRVGPKHHKGLVNSMALSVSSLARFIGPFAWGYLMSYFERIDFEGGSWFILSGLSILAFIQSFYMVEHEE